MDTTALHDGYQELLDAATTFAAADADPVPPPGEWNADQILGHVALVNAATLSAACSAASATVATYDNRLAHDTWTINRVISLVGDKEGLRARIRLQAEAICSIASSETELATRIPTLLLSHDTLLVDDLVPLRALIDGLATNELPGHARQLRGLLSAGTED